MKKIFLILIGAATLYIATAYVRMYFWEKSAEEYASVILNEIARPWSIEKLLGKASPSLKANPEEKLGQMIKANNFLLGQVNSIDPKVHCDLFRGIDSYSNESNSYANCIVSAHFEKKAAIFELQLLKKDGEWYLNDIKSK